MTFKKERKNNKYSCKGEERLSWRRLLDNKVKRKSLREVIQSTKGCLKTSK